LTESDLTEAVWQVHSSMSELPQCRVVRAGIKRRHSFESCRIDDAFCESRGASPRSIQIAAFAERPLPEQTFRAMARTAGLGSYFRCALAELRAHAIK
jgi:hypothetical protein